MHLKLIPISYIILKINTNSYQERWRDWPDEARQPPLKGERCQFLQKYIFWQIREELYILKNLFSYEEVFYWLNYYKGGRSYYRKYFN
jgi:hypothetical protein